MKSNPAGILVVEVDNVIYLGTARLSAIALGQNHALLDVHRIDELTTWTDPDNQIFHQTALEIQRICEKAAKEGNSYVLLKVVD